MDSSMGDKRVLKYVIKELIRIFVALAILPVFWPVAVLSVVALVCVRYLVQTALNLLHGKNAFKLVTGGADGIFGHKCIGNSSLIHSITILKGEPDLEIVRNRYKTRVFAYDDPLSGNQKIYEKLKHSLTGRFGFHCWQNVSDTFDITRHVKYLDGIRPNEVFTEDKLMGLMSRLMSETLSQKDEHNRLIPQWEHLIIPNYRLPHENPDSRPTHFASVYRVHHAYSDGASFAILMDSVLSNKPLQYCLDPLKGFPGMTPWKNAWIHFKALTVGPLDFMFTLKKAVLDDSPLILRTYSQKKFIDWSKPINLELLKEVRRSSHTSLGSILVNAVTESVRILHEKLAIEKGQRLEVPETLGVGNMVVMLPYPSREMQNHFTTFSVPYPLAEDNLIRRLKTTDKIGKSYLSSAEPWFHFYVLRFSSICPIMVKDFLLELPASPIVFSNIPGIKEPFQLFDRQLIEVGAWLPLFKAYGMAISTYSYCNKLRICVTSDSKLFGNQAQLKRFIKDMEDALYDMAKYHGIDLFGTKDDSSSVHYNDKLNTMRRLSAARLIANG